MTQVLVLGGTGWLSGRVASLWLERGASVTCLARGGRPAPDGATLVVADRAEPGAYASLADTEWDEIVDISSIPENVAAAVEALAGRARHWTYVSSLSAYAGNDDPGADETAALHEPAVQGEEYDYGRAKAAAEASVHSGLGDRAAIVRPGLIVGPGDPTDRFGYWVGRFALAGGEPVLAPTLEGLNAQVIDVDDLAAFIVDRGDARWHGVANATGEVIALGDLLALARETAGHTGDLVQADDEWLTAHEVAHWAGPRSLPLWLPRDMPGFATRSIAAYQAAGGRLRSLRETLERTLADERERGLDRERKSGLSRADELALLVELLRARLAHLARERGPICGCRGPAGIVGPCLRRPRVSRRSFRALLPRAGATFVCSLAAADSRRPCAHLLRRAAAGVAVSGPATQTLRWNP